jgi:hypothetical protein
MATEQGGNMSDKIDRRRLIMPALGRIYEAGAPCSYAFMRFVTGAILFPHGHQKVFYSSPDRLCGCHRQQGPAAGAHAGLPDIL